MAVRVLPDGLDGERLGWALDRALRDRDLAAAGAWLQAAAARYDAPAVETNVAKVHIHDLSHTAPDRQVRVGRFAPG